MLRRRRDRGSDSTAGQGESPSQVATHIGTPAVRTRLHGTGQRWIASRIGSGRDTATIRGHAGLGRTGCGNGVRREPQRPPATDSRPVPRSVCFRRAIHARTGWSPRSLSSRRPHRGDARTSRGRQLPRPWGVARRLPAGQPVARAVGRSLRFSGAAPRAGWPAESGFRPRCSRRASRAGDSQGRRANPAIGDRLSHVSVPTRWLERRSPADEHLVDGVGARAGGAVSARRRPTGRYADNRRAGVASAPGDAGGVHPRAGVGGEGWRTHRHHHPQRVGTGGARQPRAPVGSSQEPAKGHRRGGSRPDAA